MSTDIKEFPKFSFDRLSVLRRTPEQVEEDRRMQEEAAEHLRPLVTDSVAVAHYKASVPVEQAARAAIANAHGRLAESLFWQGKFVEAANCEIGEAKGEEYIRYHEAMESLDCVPCSCKPIQTASKASAKGQTVDCRREIQRIFVADIQREVKFIYCDTCKILFAQSA